MEIKNAIITKVSLELDHGCLTLWVYLDYGDSSGQGFGGVCLCNPEYRGMDNQEDEKNFGGMYLHNLLTTLEAKSLKDLENKPCRVQADNEKVHAIGHFLKESWFTGKIKKKLTALFTEEELAAFDPRNQGNGY